MECFKKMNLKYCGDNKLKNIKKQIKINLLITHYCNFKCFYCIAQDRMINKHALIKEEFNMFLQNIYAKFYDYEYVELMFNGGEAFTHPHIYEFIKNFLDMFSTNGRVCILTNGCATPMLDVLTKFNSSEIHKIQLVSSFHPSEIPIEDFISTIKKYYCIDIANHIRILLSEYNQHNVFEQYNMLLDAVPKWIVSIKPILIDKSTLLNLPEEYLRNIMQYTNKYLLYDNERISIEQMCFDKKYTFFNKCICLPQLFVWVDGTYTDRFCQQRNKHNCSNIFKKSIDINVNNVICNQLQCLHQCDYYTAKYFS